MGPMRAQRKAIKENIVDMKLPLYEKYDKLAFNYVDDVTLLLSDVFLTDFGRTDPH